MAHSDRLGRALRYGIAGAVAVLPTTKGDLRLEVLRPRNRTLVVAEVQVR